MNPIHTRLIGYPLATMLAAGLCWAGFGYEAEADFMTLVGSASVHAELAASIPADTPKPDGQALRAKLLRDAYGYVERAERVEPGSTAVCQLRAFLAMQEGEPLRAAQLYAQSRTLDGCTPDQLGPLVMHQAKALSNGGRVGEALELLDQHLSERRAEDVVAWRSLRTRLLARAGDTEAARVEALALADGAGQDADANEVAGFLLEDLGDFAAAEAAYRRVGLPDEMETYVIARLKLRAGDTDRATSLLGQSVSTGDPGVLRQVRRDRDLWVDTIGVGEFGRLTSPTGEPVAPSAGR